MSRQPSNRDGLRRTVAFLQVGLFLIFAGCGHDTPGDSDAPPPPSTVVMTVTGARAIAGPMRSEVRLLGKTAALRHISLRAPASGRVMDIKIETGDKVRRGQVVAHIMTREVEAAQNGLAVAREIDPSEAPALAKSIGKYEHSSGIPVRVPEDAVVNERLVSSGQIVGDLENLADLTDPRSDYVEAAVPVNYMAAIQVGMMAVVSSPIHPGIEYPMRVAGIGPALNQNGATSPARLEFTTGQRLTEADAPVEVRVTAKLVPDAVSVPAPALFQDAASDSYYVFVAGADSLAHRTPVSIGISTPSQVQITAGLRPGAIVITSGGYALSNGLKVNVAMAQQ